MVVVKWRFAVSSCRMSCEFQIHMFVSRDTQKSNLNKKLKNVKLTNLAYFLNHHFALFSLALDVLDLATKPLGVVFTR